MSSEFEEGAKATQEVAKATGKGIDLVQSLGSWFDGRLSNTLDATISWAMTDRILEARDANRIRIKGRLLRLAHATQAQLEADGILSIYAPSDRLISGLIAGASVEDDPALQDMWAALLAKTLTSTDQDNLQWVAILRDLRPVDASALAAYYAAEDPIVLDEFVAGRQRIKCLSGEAFGFQVTRNLSRLGLIEPTSAMISVVTDIEERSSSRREGSTHGEVEYSGGLYQVQLTETGTGFCRAVGLPDPTPASAPAP